MPVLFSPIDPQTLYFASNVVWKTTTGGKSWTQISPDLTRKTWDVPPNVGKYIGTRRPRSRRSAASIYTIAPSPLDVNRIWAGTDDGLIHVTTDGGKTWTDVTPPELKPWAKVSLMDASHFDARTAYAAINTFRLDDLRPHIYRTRDGGKTWTHITNGIPDGGIVNAVREDPKRRGLLFAGTRAGGLRVVRRRRALAVAAAEHAGDVDPRPRHQGRRSGRRHARPVVLDPRRHHAAAPDGRTATKGDDFALSSHPAQAWRVRWNKNTDTPLPPDEPAGQNPPDGAILNYWLPADAREVSLEILDAGGSTVVRRYSSTISYSILKPSASTSRATGSVRRSRCPRKRGSIGSSGTCTTLPRGYRSSVTQSRRSN